MAGFALDDVDPGLAVGRAIDLAHAEEGLARDQARPAHKREFKLRQWGCNGFVTLVDRAIAEQRLVGWTGLPIG